MIVSRLDHDANVSPWTALQRRGVTVRHVDFDPGDCTLDMKGLKRAVNSRTRLIAIGYASNAVGTVNDVPRVVELARSVGAWTFVRCGPLRAARSHRRIRARFATSWSALRTNSSVPMWASCTADTTCSRLSRL